MNSIVSKGLTKHYSRGKIKALDNFNITVEEGTIFSLLGPNGAGKTTFFKLLLSIVKPTSGTGEILGIDIADPKSRAQIGYLSEQHIFPGYLTAEQVLYYYGRMSLVPTYIIKEKIPDLLKKVKLFDSKDLKVKKFSKGMLQRLGTAQVLINDPKIIFLDEPTDGIDPIGRIEIREILSNLKEEGKTIFINSHLLSEVERISDSIAILNKGKLIKQGKLEEFLKDTGKYKLKVQKELTGSLRSMIDKGIIKDLSGGNYLVSVETTEKLNNIIDLIRNEHIDIIELSPVKETLEDHFIKIIGK